jgi:hypothetical protein
MIDEFVLRGDGTTGSAAAVAAAMERLGLTGLDIAPAAGDGLRVRAGGTGGAVAVHRLAAALGCSVAPPGEDWCWRPARPAPQRWAAHAPAPARRAARWVATARVPGPARSLALTAGGTAVVAYDPPRGATTPPVVQVRGGADLEEILDEYSGLAAPVAIAADASRFAAIDQDWASRGGKLPPGIRLLGLGDDGTDQRWSIGGLFGWLPGVPPRLVALTRHPFMRRTPPAGPAAATLAALERGDAIRAVVADPAAGSVSALAASKVLDDTLYQEPNLAVAGGTGTVVVASCHHLTGLPLDGGEPRWVHPPTGTFVSHWYAAASSTCGRLVAFGGNHWHDDPNLLVLDAADGTVWYALDTRSFGTRAPVRALAFHPDGWLAVGLGDGQVRHITLTGAVVAYRGIAGSLAALAFTPDGAALLVGGASLQGLRRIELG